MILCHTHRWTHLNSSSHLSLFTEAKGKGQLQTYWLAPKSTAASSTAMSNSSMADFDAVGSLGSMGAISDDDGDEDENQETRVIMSRNELGMLEAEV